ncbi:MAG TPA: hypothetical protein VEA58_07205 [Anaerovoracaceae bacterium]|nr:hypothetical protein [Anaerovoracaceae bacterium]
MKEDNYVPSSSEQIEALVIERWPDQERVRMIRKSEFYPDREQVYQYGYYDGYQRLREAIVDVLDSYRMPNKEQEQEGSVANTPNSSTTDDNQEKERGITITSADGKQTEQGDLVASSSNTDDAPVATLGSSVGNSIEQIVTKFEETGECEVCVPLVVRLWDETFSISQWKDEYRLVHYNRDSENFTRTDLKVTISKRQAKEIIVELDLYPEQSTVFKHARTWRIVSSQASVARDDQSSTPADQQIKSLSDAVVYWQEKTAKYQDQLRQKDGEIERLRAIERDQEEQIQVWLNAHANAMETVESLESELQHLRKELETRGQNNY